MYISVSFIICVADCPPLGVRIDSLVITKVSLSLMSDTQSSQWFSDNGSPEVFGKDNFSWSVSS